MKENHAAIAKAYYTAMGDKDTKTMGTYLHPEVEFIGPLATITSKEALLDSAKKLQSFLNGVTIRTVFADQNQAMIVFDLNCYPPVGICPAASLMTFKDNLIIRIQAFYDARPFEAKRDEIFSK